VRGFGRATFILPCTKKQTGSLKKEKNEQKKSTLGTGTN
jgi:hypothetical protein